MNKYQDALNKIVKSCCPNCIDENGCFSCDIEKICNATAKSWVNTLQELVDKETPKKVGHDCLPHPTIDNEQLFDCYYCPNCDEVLDEKDRYDYCPHCGKKLDWSDEDENS